MNEFLKIENVIAIELLHYGPSDHKFESEQAHTKALRDASVRYVHAGQIDEVVPVTISIKDDEDNSMDIEACYLIMQHGGAVMDRNSAGPRDRDSWFLVPGKPEDWLSKIHTALNPQPEEEAEPEPDTRTCINDRGPWAPDTAYAVWDVASDPTNKVQKYLCVKPHTSGASRLDLSNTNEWRPLGEITL